MKRYREIILYLIFGVATTLVNWIVYLIFNNFVFGSIIQSQTAAQTAANAVAWFLAVLFAFVTNKIIVFNSKDNSPKVLIREAISFYAARGITGILEIFVPPFMAKVGLTFTLCGERGLFPTLFTKCSFLYTTLSDNGLVPKIIVAVIVIILNYIFSKLFIFKKKQ